MDVWFVTSTQPLCRHKHHTSDATECNILTAIKQFQSLAVIDNLVCAGVDLNIKGDDQWTPLTLAAHTDNMSVVEYLVQKRIMTEEGKSMMVCDVNKSNGVGDSALICAAKKGHLQICEILISAGAEINQLNPCNHQTPLTEAIDHQRVEVVDLLLSQGADVQMIDNVRITPLSSAVKLRETCVSQRIVEKLIKAGCDVNIGSQDQAPVFLTSRFGVLPVVKLLCEAGCSVNVSNKYGVTPLYEACLKGHNDIVSYLLEQHCHVNAPDMYGVTPLHVAAICDNPKAIDLLIKAGAMVKLRDQNGRSAVHSAIEQGKSVCVERFLRHGVNITHPPTSIKRLPCLATLFQRKYIDTITVLIRGCSSLPLSHCPGIIDVFRENRHLVKTLLLSGIQQLPELLTLPKHPSTCLLDPTVMELLEKFSKTPLQLKSICRIQIRRCLGNKILFSVSLLPIPVTLQDYLELVDL